MSKIGFVDPELLNLMGRISPDVQNVIVIMIAIFNISSLQKSVVALRVFFSFCFSILHKNCLKSMEFDINSNSVAKTLV